MAERGSISAEHRTSPRLPAGCLLVSTAALVTACSSTPAAAGNAQATIAGEGHEWPGGPTLPARDTSVLGAQSNAINADTTMWAFFQAHPLP